MHVASWGGWVLNERLHSETDTSEHYYLRLEWEINFYVVSKIQGSITSYCVDTSNHSRPRREGGGGFGGQLRGRSHSEAGERS